MNRFEVANLTILALIVVVTVAGPVAAGWGWWAFGFGVLGFFGGALFIERLAPGTRLLFWLGWDGTDSDETPDRPRD